MSIATNTAPRRRARRAMLIATALGLVLAMGACSSSRSTTLTRSPTPPSTPSGPCSGQARAAPWTHFILSVTDVVAANGAAYISYGEPFAGKVAALRASDGTVLWERPDPILGTAQLALAGDTLLLGNSTHLAALSTSDGAVRWQRPIDGMPYAASGGHLFVPQRGVVYPRNPSADQSPEVRALDEADGSVSWVRSLDAAS